MKGLLYLTILGLYFLPVHAQDSTRLKNASEKALQIYLSNPDSVLLMTEEILRTAVENKNTYYEGLAYFIFSKAYWVKANYRLSTEYGFKALRIFENSPHRKELVESELSLARTLTELGNYSHARDLILRSFAIAKNENNDFITAEASREYSYLLAETEALDSALYYTNKGIAIFEKMNKMLDASILYGRKARILFTMKDYAQSREFALKSIKMDSVVGNSRGLGIGYYQLAQNEFATGNYRNAEDFVNVSIKINEEIGNLAWVVRAHELLGHIYLKTNRPNLAADHYHLVSQYKDSLYNAEKSGQIQEMQSLYELEGKENRIKLLEQQNALRQQEVKNQQLFLAFLIVGILLLVALITFMLRLRAIQSKTNKDLEAKNQAIDKQREEMQTQAENLQKLNEMKSKLFSVISHDLRGPISNVQALLDLFTKKLMTADEFIMISDKLKANLNSTQRILENLLNWALSQMDGIKTKKEKLEVKACIEESIRLLEEIASRKSITIEKNIDDTLHVMADPNQLQLVLRNLIHNAIKFSKSDSRILINAVREDGAGRITVKDSGIGMTLDEMNTIVASKEHFTKVGTLQEKGTGLGLLLCQEFIARNGGTFHITSHPGEGTEVSFTLAAV